MALLLEDMQFDYRKLKDVKHLLEHMKKIKLPNALTLSSYSSLKSVSLTLFPPSNLISSKKCAFAISKIPLVLGS